MQEGMKRNKNPNPTKHIFLPLLHTLPALSTKAQTPHQPLTAAGLCYTASSPLWSDTDSPGGRDDMTKGLSPTPLLLPR